MRIILIIPTIFVLAILCYPTVSNSFGSGSPGGKTNSPLDGQNCTACHSGNIQQNIGNDIVSITTNIPSTGYLIGSTYTITLTGVGGSQINKYGFELTAENMTGKSGNFLITDITTKLVNSNNAVTHKASGTSGNNSKSWSVDWTPTASSSLSTTFYATLMFANGNNNTSGDQVYTLSLSVQEAQNTALNDSKIESFIFDKSDMIIKNTEPFVIYDITGKFILKKHKNATSNLNINTGTYIIKSKSKSQKIIIN